MEKVIECPYCNDKDRCFEDVQDTSIFIITIVGT